jgi:hypothetical protein
MWVEAGVGMERSGMTYPAGTSRAFRPEALTDLLCDVWTYFIFFCIYLFIFNFTFFV